MDAPSKPDEANTRDLADTGAPAADASTPVVAPAATETPKVEVIATAEAVKSEAAAPAPAPVAAPAAAAPAATSVAPAPAAVPVAAAVKEEPASASTTAKAAAPAKAAVPQPPVATTRVVGLRQGAVRKSGQMSDKLWSFAENQGFYAAGAIVAVGLGWIIGANTFESRTDGRKLAEALTMLDGKVEAVAARAVTSNDVAVLRRNLDEMKRTLEASRKNSAAVADLSARFEAAERNRVALTDKLADKIGDKLNRDQTERFDRLAERLDRLERQVSAPLTTASINPLPVPPPAPPVPANVSTTPRAAESNVQSSARESQTVAERARMPANGYVLREVHGGVALVESRRGLREIAPGDSLPGAGRVQAIERRGRQWVVVTSNGVIDANGY